MRKWGYADLVYIKPVEPVPGKVIKYLTLAATAITMRICQGKLDKWEMIGVGMVGTILALLGGMDDE